MILFKTTLAHKPASISSFERLRDSNPHVRIVVELNQKNYLNMNNYHFLARRSALLGYGKDGLAQYQDNVTESASGISGHDVCSLISK